MTTKLEGYTVCHIQACKISSLKSRLCLSVCASLSKSVKYLKAAAAQFLSLLFFFFFGGRERLTSELIFDLAGFYLAWQVEPVEFVET